MRLFTLKERNMKKLAVYSALLVTLLAVTACENRNNSSNNPNQPPSRERQGPQNPNQPPGDQNQR
jgi:ABC-type Fe3+-citrate transport system substrate-binding protein